jgi:hypothetical protein
MKTLWKLPRRPVKLDGRTESGFMLDLKIVERGIRESLLGARLFRPPARSARGRR